MNESLRTKYLQTVNRLIRLRRTHRDLRSREEKLKNQLEYLQARITDTVCNEKDKNDKLVFSNDIHRRAAGTVRLYEDPEYRRITQELESVQQYMAEASDRYFLLSEKRNILSLDLVGENTQLVLFYEPKDMAARSNIESPRDLYSSSMLELLRSDQDIRVDVQLNH